MILAEIGFSYFYCLDKSLQSPKWHFCQKTSWKSYPPKPGHLFCKLFLNLSFTAIITIGILQIKYFGVLQVMIIYIELLGYFYRGRVGVDLGNGYRVHRLACLHFNFEIPLYLFQAAASFLKICENFEWASRSVYLVKFPCKLGGSLKCRFVSSW